MYEEMTFEEMVSMYINDCMQYLNAKLEGKKPDLAKEEFQKTKNHNEIYEGLRKLEDLCIKVAGGFPLKWEKQK